MSETTEDYLKAIYLAESAELPTKRVPVGHVASAIGVVPGTATTMMKGLAESGLVDYRPYEGVRLTAAGERLAGSVIRRHRLIEAFLVKVVGMSWVEVHDEAERLEHAVSDRLIERMNEMLGSPTVDPHGDPIPSSTGTRRRGQNTDLLTAPLHRALLVTRVLDQTRKFLRFVESHGLIPGNSVTIDTRVRGAATVEVRSARGETVTLRRRAASKILVSVAA